MRDDARGHSLALSRRFEQYEVVDRERILAVVASYAASRADVVACYVFGSVARGTAREDSDVDVAVLFTTPPVSTMDSPVFAIADDLQEQLRKPVDVIALETASPDLIHRILRDGVIVHEADKAKRIAFEIDSRNRYFDLLPYLLRYRGMERAP